MALPTTTNLDFAFLETGPFCQIASKSTVDTNTLDYAFLEIGPFVSASVAAEEAASTQRVYAFIF